MPEVDIFLIGVPKAGTTWLAYTLNQHHSITLSDPKEPNIIASHRGTFVRSNEEPDWRKFETLFNHKGLKLDASIHAFACPLSPSRIKQKLPHAKFILCLREPVSRTFSHWNMIQNTNESVDNGVDRGHKQAKLFLLWELLLGIHRPLATTTTHIVDLLHHISLSSYTKFLFQYRLCLEITVLFKGKTFCE